MLIEEVMKFHLIDNKFLFQKILNCVLLSFSLFEFIIEISTLKKFPQDTLIGFVSLFPYSWSFYECNN